MVLAHVAAGNGLAFVDGAAELNHALPLGAGRCEDSLW